MTSPPPSCTSELDPFFTKRNFTLNLVDLNRFMNEGETAEEEEEAKKRAVAGGEEEKEVLVPFLPNCCLAVAPSATTSSNSTLAGHGGTQWSEAESEAAPKWQLQQPNSSFCGREMTLGTSNNSSLSSSQWSGQQGQHVNCRFLGAVGQQTSVSFGNLSSQNSSSSSSSVHHHHHRSAKKRIRTTFGRSQLDTLRECFKRSHKPNSAQLCTLVRRTGLSKRVIQVSSR